MRRVRCVLRVAAALVMAVVLAAHVGSPNVYYSGKAGAYTVDVTIQPPQVVPGIAEILVHVAEPGVSRVAIELSKLVSYNLLPPAADGSVGIASRCFRPVGMRKRCRS